LPLYTELAMHEANFAAKLLPPALWINDFGFLKSIYRRCTGQGLAKLLRHLRSNGAFTLVGLQPVPILLAARIYCRPKPEPSGSEKTQRNCIVFVRTWNATGTHFFSFLLSRSNLPLAFSGSSNKSRRSNHPHD